MYRHAQRSLAMWWTHLARSLRPCRERIPARKPACVRSAGL